MMNEKFRNMSNVVQNLQKNVMIILDGEQCLFVQHHKSLPVNKKGRKGL